jgi:hypothetical protein
MSDNKYVDQVRERIQKTALLAGHFPQVQYSEGKRDGETGSVSFTSFSLFEWADIMNRYRRCMHKELMKRGHGRGIYEKLRSKAWMQVVDDVGAKIKVVGSKDLKEGQEITLNGLFSSGPREAKLLEVDIENGIIMIDVHETNGHYNDIGSAYIHEVQTVETEESWCVFDLTEDERKFKAEVEQAMRG